jgi:hypothetical protein
MLHKIEKIMQEHGKQNLESNSITQSFLNESFEAFVDQVLDLASSTGNETTTLWFELRINRCPVSEKKICRQARQQSIFGNILF